MNTLHKASCIFDIIQIPVYIFFTLKNIKAASGKIQNHSTENQNCTNCIAGKLFKHITTCRVHRTDCMLYGCCVFSVYSTSLQRESWDLVAQD